MQIDLRGAEGNAFSLMAIVSRVARQCGMSKKSANDLAASMRSGTYIDLLDVMDRAFPKLFNFLGDPREVSQAD
jgi:hypothetical protein